MQKSKLLGKKGLSKNRKIFLFFILSLCFIPLFLHYLGVDFSSNSASPKSVINEQELSDDVFQSMSASLLHVFLDWSAVVLVFIVAIFSFLHYRVKHYIIVPMLGLAFLSVGLVDVIHTLAAAKILTPSTNTSNFLPFTWALSRMFNAITMLFVAVFSLWFSKIINQKTEHQQVNLLLIIAVVFTVTVAFIFWGTISSSSFPQTVFPKAFVTRPYDILPLAMFLAAGVFYWLWYNEKTSVLRFTLMISMIPQVIAQFHMAYGSVALYDSHFNIAHLLKIIAYGSILFGFVLDIIQQEKMLVNKKVDKKTVVGSTNSYTNVSVESKLPYKVNLGIVRWPLAFKIPVVGFLFSLLISLIFAYTFYVESYQLVQEKEMSELTLEAKIIKPLFSKFYHQSGQDVSFLSATPPISGMMLAKKADDDVLFSLWQQRLSSIFIELLKTKPHYNRMSFIAVSSTNDALVSAKRMNNKVVNLKGDELPKNIKLIRLNEMLDNINERLFFSTMSIENAENEFTNTNSASSSFYVATAIMTPDSAAIFGIIAIEVDLLSYIKELKEHSLKDISFYIADDKGDFLYYSSKEKPNQKSTNIKEEFSFLNEYITNNVEHAEIYNFEKHNKNNSLAFYSKMNFEFIQQVPPLHLLIENHNDEFLSAIQNMRFRVVLISLSLALVCLVISIFAARKIIKPLAKMTRSLSSYEKTGTIGDFPTKEKDEIGLLARSFQHLFAKIEHKSNQLKQVATHAENTNLKLEAILNSIVDAVITIDSQGKILAFNKSARKMFGYEEAEVLNQNIKILMPVSFAKYHDKYIQDHLLTGQSKIIGVGRELPALRKNGQVFHMHLSINEVVTDEEVIYTGLIRDITEHRQLEIENKRILLEAKNAAWRLNFALSAPKIGVWDFDLATKKMLWDERMYLLFSVSPETKYTPKNLWQKMIHPDDREQVEILIKEAVKSDKEIQYKHRIVLPDGQIRYVEAHAQVMFDEEGNKVSIVGTYRDNTEQSQLEILKQDALDMAEESLRLKSEFLASMSHEIRTPMNGVLGMLGLLEQSALSKQQAHQVELANSSAQSLLALINDILDFSKIEAGKLELEILAFDIRKQFGELAESMAIRAQEKNLELILDLVGVNYSIIKGDPSRLRQILSNLVGNAIKFTPSGEVVIKASLKECDNQLKLICSVTDTGIGIPADKVQSLFDSFTQVDATTTRKYGGTGLGLAIVKQLCVLMGGDVSIESEVNQGSRVTFSINLEKSEKAEKVLPIVDIKGFDVLIVEDNITNLNVLSEQLTVWGANVTQFQNSAQALDFFKQISISSFSIIFIDMYLPNIDGITLGKRILENSNMGESKLILMTPMGEAIDSKHLSDIGFTSYFPKPATTTDLFDALSAATSNKRNADFSERPSSTESSASNLQQLIGNKLPKNSKILLVEDNRINQAVILGVLANISLHADVVENGLEAIDILIKSEVDSSYQLIIMDCQMPELDGYETTKRIRKGNVGERYKAIPIIAMTANAMKGDEEKCFAAGMSDYATKPVDATELQQKLCQWLGVREQVLDEDNKVVEHSKTENASMLYAAEEGNAVWQKQEFLKRVRNNERLAKNLIELFIQEAPTLVKSLQAALEENDYEEIIGFSHKLKGSARNLGGNNLGSVCEHLENNPNNMDEEQVNLYKKSLEEEFDLLIQALKSYLD